MIFTNLKNKQNKTLPEKIQKCIEYINKTDVINTFETGVHLIEEIGVRMSYENYNSKELEKGFWESHVKCIDVQIMLDGEEHIYVTNIENLNKKSEELDRDLIIYDKTEKTEKSSFAVPLQVGDVLVLYPEDGHMPGISIGENRLNKKVVFKVEVF